MSTTYRRVSFGGVVVAVDRYGDGGFEVSFGVPPPGASAEVWAEYRTNEHFRRYEADVAAGATVTDEPVTIARQASVGLIGTVTTTGTTPAELLRLPIAAHTELDCSVRVNAVSRDETQVRKLVADATFGRAAGGPVQIGVTTQVALHQTAGAAGWTSPVTIQGNDLVVTVTGSGGLTVDWSIAGTAYRFGQSGV